MHLSKIVSIFLLLPLLSIAQKKSIENNNLPLIVSISSDTINGNYKEIRFVYDKQNRVTSIFDLNCKISNSKINKSKADTTKKQFFEYISNNKMPSLRKLFTYEFNKKVNKWIWKTNELQYYIYENGKKVRDSVFYRENNIEKPKYADFKNTFEKSEATTNLIGDGITRTYTKSGIAYIQELYYNDNIIQDIFGYNYSGRGNGIVKSEFEKFDKAINPFNQLNIASALYMEKISFSINEIDLISLHKDFHDWGIEFMWHFNSKNNPLIYLVIKNRGREAPGIYDKVHLMYTYNQNKQPVYCVALTKKIDHPGEYLGSFLNHFTFRYSNE